MFAIIQNFINNLFSTTFDTYQAFIVVGVIAIIAVIIVR